MSTSETNLFDPPLQGVDISDGLTKWLFTLQRLQPLVLINTTAAPETIALPAAGLNSSTGESNQNQELTYRRIAGGNNATITGSADGPQVLTANTGAGSVVKFKSNGTSWYVTKWP